MITLERDYLEVQFPEVHQGVGLRISFQRTLRVPDDNQEYPLPAGLGRFPIRHVDDFKEKLPPPWKQHGGVILPLYQAEALWLHFQANYPMAVKVSAGKINAITGGAFSNDLSGDPQDYVVVPEQPWLDGFCIRKGSIRQFVAMPLGEGFTAEEQLTGAAEHGGIQLVCYPMRREAYDEYKVLREEADARRLQINACYSRKISMDMGLAPGGVIRQQIHKDPHGINAWDINIKSRCFVHIANSQLWRAITGESLPPSPVTRRQYEASRIPWFDFYFADSNAMSGSKRLAGMDSVAATSIKKGCSPGELSAPVTLGKLIDLSPRKKVRDGSY